MSQASKIEKHNLIGQCVALFQEGRTTMEIADALTEALAGKDTISQAAVARYLKPIRQEEREETGRQVTKHISKSIGSDLEVLDEGQLYHVLQARDQDNPHKVRSDAWLKAGRFVEIKLRYAISDPNSTESAIHPVDLEDFRNDLAAFRETCDG